MGATAIQGNEGIVGTNVELRPCGSTIEQQLNGLALGIRLAGASSGTSGTWADGIAHAALEILGLRLSGASVAGYGAARICTCDGAFDAGQLPCAVGLGLVSGCFSGRADTNLCIRGADGAGRENHLKQQSAHRSVTI